MGKNNRHKKLLKSERAKVKLKGKTLPKGTNVTNTTFKVRKIIIGEQLKNVGVNKVDIATQIKDCLSKLRHHNHKICMGSLNNLKCILTKYSVDIIDNQFSPILKNLSSLSTNEEKDVRRESFTVLQALLRPIVDKDSRVLMPYYDVLSSYLCCAMTHIDPRIQNDSLLFLDVLLKLVPSIVTNNYSRIMDNFLDMISKLRIESKSERSLTLNLNSKISTIKWRVNVLQKLQLMLQVLVDFMRNNSGIEKGNQDIEVAQNYSFRETIPVYLGVYDDHNLKINGLGLFSGSNKNFNASLTQENDFKSKIVTLMPLLFETWLEVKLNSIKGSSGCYILNNESMALLTSIMEIMISLRFFVQIQADEENSSTDWFYKKYRKDFINYIVDGFPYSGNRNLSKNIPASRYSDCLIQNINICYMFVLFCKDCNLKQKHQYSTILNYVTNSLFKICTRNEDYNIYQVLEDMLLCIFFEMGAKSYKNGISLESLLDSLIQLFYGEINTYVRKIIFKILCRISQDTELQHLHKSSKYLSWIQSLPIMLCNLNLTLEEVQFLIMLSRHNNIEFLESVLSELPRILDTITHCTDTQFISTVINILYYVPGLTANDINLIKNAVDKCDIPAADKNYMKTVLSGFNTY